MDLIQAIIISVLQGVSELFPVSSLGHAVLLPKLLGWHIDEKASYWLAFLVALHLGTATALLMYFRNEWLAVAVAFVRTVQRGRIGASDDERLAWMVVLGTIPAGVVGFVLEHPLRSLFGSPSVAASFLIINGLIMIGGEFLLRRQLAARAELVDDMKQLSSALVAGSARPSGNLVDENRLPKAGRYRDISELSWRDAAIVGFAQVGALIPGISRSGITMVSGLIAGLTHEAAARYAFLLATPIIAAAGVLELPRLFEPGGRSVLGEALLGMVLAGVAAYFSVRFLMRYFQFGRLYPFAFYSCAVGALSLLWLTLH